VHFVDLHYIIVSQCTVEKTKYELLSAVLLKIHVLLYVTLFHSSGTRCFEGVWCPHLQG